jgi:integrase
MPKVKLTDRWCANIRATSQTDYFDEATPGLAMRVSKRSKTWNLHVTVAGKLKRLRLGSYPGMSLAAARARAIETKSNAAEGKPTERGSLQAIAEEYLSRETHLRSIGQRRKIFERLIFPVLGQRPIDEIRRSEVVRLLDRIVDERGPVMADYVLAVLGKLFNWWAIRDENFRSPIVKGMARTKPKERARTRVLSDDELRSIWEAAKAGGEYGAYIRLVLLTACRRTEVSRMAWAEISNGDWLIPAWRYKTNRDHLVPLSGAALAILSTLPRNGLHVFLPRGGRIFGSDRKAKLEQESGTSGWRTHDLRRTARSLMSRAGINSDVAERCLGHTLPTVRATYDRHSYYNEKRHAFEALAAQIERIVHPQENVVTMRGGVNV